MRNAKRQLDQIAGTREAQCAAGSGWPRKWKTSKQEGKDKLRAGVECLEKGKARTYKFGVKGAHHDNLQGKPRDGGALPGNPHDCHTLMGGTSSNLGRRET
ncbi:hypothetical protein ACFQ3P_41150 [Paraburkholderia sabiae]|uniref:Tox-GHH2 domain-containing protein n=1 Tax=Paraburkholderia sabiae TaxID=273251 RepID=A0ABU9QT38_9BURK|nr:hypothetical protein [Paraburkholderia sabiae]WJZ79552.1 hypothetical protein QEN71_40300 [Paraburkholderia sabiae]CAD6563416.1 hypothetical protein LMG24235_08660 [Paraburkholderia sabiae]